MEAVKTSTKTLSKALTVLKQGGVIICPTDTVYGFLADASNKKAVDKIFKIKKRPKQKPLPVFVKNLKMAKSMAVINKEQEKIIRRYWPGKYTFVLKSKIKPQKLKLYGVAKDSVALRVPKHYFLQKLLKKINRPLVQTSVNISGRPTLVKISDIIKKFKKNKPQPDLIIDAGFLKNKPSKIIDLTSGHLTRIR
ncbi:MAG: threonylcarbamoyl-AMP synthase [Candidatus Staskawiczbacteria bacterium]|nr:threonylcarbamoyl-AMP synthase [Candidatus Staskawiczbacteria bacterium]